MKNIYRSLNNTPYYNRIFKGIKHVTITSAAQFVVQAVGLLSGILILRLLPVKEYAIYTIANTVLGTLTLLADGGISTGVLSQGAKVWNDKMKLGAVISTGLNLRKKFAIYGLIIVIPILIYLLKHNGASWLMCLLIIISLTPAFFAELSDSLLEVAPKLLQDIKKLQINQIQTSLGKILMLGLFLFIFPWTYIALLASGIPRILANIRLRKISENYADLNQQPNVEVKKNIVSVVKKILPGAIYYCFSGQIVIWLISIVGSTTAIASVGALGRLAMGLSIFSVTFTTLIAPRFAKLPNVRFVLLSRFIIIQIGLAVATGVIVLFVWIFSNQLLWILGKPYQHMQHEILLNMIGSCLALIAGCSFTMYTNRGWVINPLISIPIDFMSIVLALFLINVSTISGVFLFNIFVASAQVLMHSIFCLIKIMHVNEAE